MQSKKQFQILIVDDDPLIAESLKLILPEQWNLHHVPSAAQVLSDLLSLAAYVDMH